MTSRRAIGFWTAVALVMGNMIGSGVFLLPASLARYGGLSLLGWLVSAVGSLLLALVFARLARRDPAAGGPYAYTREAFGDLAGFLVAWGYWISVWCANAALAVALVGYLDRFIPSIVRSPSAAALLAIAIVWVLTGVNALSVRAAGGVQVVTTALKILPLLLVGIGGLALFEPAHFSVPPQSAATFGVSLIQVVTLTLWAFLGLECATVPASAVRDPERTIPRATMIGTLVTAAIYILGTAGVMSLVAPSRLASSTAPFADAAAVLGGEWLATVVALGAVISCFGALNGWILIVGQLPLAVANDGLFPRAFAVQNSRGTPARGMIIAAGLSTVLIGMNYSQGLVALFTFIILLATLSTLVPYVFCSMAGFLIDRRAGSTSMGGLRGARPAIIAILAFGYALLAVGGAGAEAVYWGFLLLLSGIPVYVWVVRQRRGAS